jgi:hypothetical protein
MADESWRPWHGRENPLEAMYQHFAAQIEALKAQINPAPAPTPAPSPPKPAA